jgi:hypothetical protein
MRAIEKQIELDLDRMFAAGNQVTEQEWFEFAQWTLRRLAVSGRKDAAYWDLISRRLRAA